MRPERQNNQLELAFPEVTKGEAPKPAGRGTESLAARTDEDGRVIEGSVMEKIVEAGNLKKALKQVQRNKGAAGVDGMTVSELGPYLKEHWTRIRSQLLDGTYKPQPVKRVDIPKATGGTRPLGIPTVLDRFIQQAVLQVLQPDWDPTFSAASFGFRPGRSAHQAVKRAQELVASGLTTVVDIDLEKFFDRVNHDILMGLVARRVTDRRLAKLIRGYLTAGVMVDGLVSATGEGTPQGGPLSPLLSNLMLDGLDKELEARGLARVRYADDCNIYVRSRRAGERVMASVTRFLKNRLKLKVNDAKSAVDSPQRRKFLGFSFTGGKGVKRRIAPQSLERFKSRIRDLTRRKKGRRLEHIVQELSRYLSGWRGYFGFCETPTVLLHLDEWIRRRLRAVVWHQWKRNPTRKRELMRRGVREYHAGHTVWRNCGTWRQSHSQALEQALPNRFFRSLGLVSLANP